MDPEIVEDDDNRQREQSDADKNADDRHRIAERGFSRVFADAAADRSDDQFARQIAAWKAAAITTRDVGDPAILGGASA